MNATPSESTPNLLQQFFSVKLNWLLIFIPVAVALDSAGVVAAPVLFFIAGVAIIPIAALIVRSTEQLATYTGDAVGGLLNATFGNAPELIICIVALKAGYVEMVRGAIIGGILANLLLALGAAFFLGGLRHHDQRFNPAASRTYSTMMFLAAVSMAVPSTFSQFFTAGETAPQEQLLGLGIAGLLLLAYGLYLLFSLKTHSKQFESVEGGGGGGHHDGPRWSMPRAIVSLLAASVLAAWMSEILVGAAEETGKALGMSEMFIGIVFLAVIGGAAESGSAIAMARKNKVDLTVEHRARELHTDRALHRARPRLRELPGRAGPARTGVHAARGGGDVHRGLHRLAGLRGRPVELVQGRAAHGGVRHHRPHVLLHADAGALRWANRCSTRSPVSRRSSSA